MTTRSIGIKGNNGALQQLNRTVLLLLNIAFSFISFVVCAPLLVSVIDHSKSVFALCDLGHLHHMHEYSALADLCHKWLLNISSLLQEKNIVKQVSV